MRPLNVPNLPEKRVRLCTAGSEHIAERLREYGVNVLVPVPCARLPEETAAHADMLLCHAGGNTVFTEPSQGQIADALKNYGFDVRISDAVGNIYPADVLLNVAVSKDVAVGNFQYADRGLYAYLRNSGVKLLHTKQGYAKCSLCFVTGNAFITEDTGIAKTLTAIGKGVLQIAPGDVCLSERHHGFFGGAAGLLAPDTLAVTGALSAHRDGDSIRAFLKKYKVRPLELTGGKITDIGGILPLTEE